MRVEEGTGYLLEESEPVTSYRVFQQLSRYRPGFCVTRKEPARMRRLQGLERVETHWIGGAAGDRNRGPAGLAPLEQAIERFVELRGGNGVILLDDLEDLIADNDFSRVLLFLERLNDVIMQHRAILLIRVSPLALSPRDLALLERSFTPADLDGWREELEAKDWGRRLEHR